MDKSRLEQLLEQAMAAYHSDEYDKALRLYQLLLKQSESIADSTDDVANDVRLQALRWQGRVLQVLSRHEESLASYEQYYLEAGTNERAMEALALIGVQHSQMGHHHKALGAHREALQLARAFNNTAGRARAHAGMGAAYRGLGRYEESVLDLEKALALFQQVGDKEEQARTSNHLGISYARLGQLDKSIIAFKRGLELAREVSTLHTAVQLSNLGETYQVLYDFQQAFIHHQEAVALYEGMDLPGSIADVYRNLGIDLFYLGQTEEGMRYMRRGLQLAERSGRPNIHMQALYSLALAKIEQGEVELSQMHMQTLKQMAQAQDTTGYQAKALHLEGLYHKLAREFMQARQSWQQATILAQETGQQMLIWQLHAAQASIADNDQIAAVHYRIAAEIIQQIVYPIEDEKLRQTFLKASAVRDVLSQVT
jgi:tetratricopeptide (TPR) repeat protein